MKRSITICRSCLIIILAGNIASAQTINTIAGTGGSGYTGDGGQAAAATFFNPASLALDTSGNLYIGDLSNSCIRKITASTGIITTAPGTAGLFFPVGIVVDAAKNIYVSEWTGNRIRKITSAGVSSIFAGTGTAGFSGDGSLATAAELNMPYDLELDAAQNNLYVADAGNQRIRKINLNTGIITTIAGTGVYGYNGDGISADTATLAVPSALAMDAANNLFILDKDNARIRMISSSTGMISTVAGSGISGYTGDGGPATAATMSYQCYGLTLDASRNVFFSDMDHHCIREILDSSGIIHTVAGTGAAGFSGDGGPAALAELNGPRGLLVNRSGNLIFADQMNNRIREITPDSPQAVEQFSLNGKNENANISMYPNPVSEQLTIESSHPDFELKISDACGKIVYKTTCAQTGKTEVNTRDFPGGIYFVEIRSTDFVETRKMVVVKY
ncbi:MAG: T9SS type A sorting domain-containing protein [Bacteroidetes bacterium]|nr:T9SS type A sorting domain-containing protein [Bacteroidota bacterium]